MNTNKRKFNLSDQMINNNFKLIRMVKGKSRSDIAEILNVSVQQIQKYEKGSNRISAGNLEIIATALQIDIGEFYKKRDYEAQKLFDFDKEQEKDLINFSRAFLQIPLKEQRQALIKLIRAMVPKTNRAVGE